MIVPLLGFLGATILSLYLAVVWDTEAEKLLSDRYRPTGLVAVWDFACKVWRDYSSGNQVAPSARNTNGNDISQQVSELIDGIAVILRTEANFTDLCAGLSNS